MGSEATDQPKHDTSRVTRRGSIDVFSRLACDDLYHGSASNLHTKMPCYSTIPDGENIVVSDGQKLWVGINY